MFWSTILIYKSTKEYNLKEKQKGGKSKSFSREKFNIRILSIVVLNMAKYTIISLKLIDLILYQ